MLGFEHDVYNDFLIFFLYNSTCKVFFQLK